MTHHTTLVQRCRATNSLLADELQREFLRLENDRSDAADEIETLLEALKMAYAISMSDLEPGEYVVQEAKIRAAIAKSETV